MNAGVWGTLGRAQRPRKVGVGLLLAALALVIGCTSTPGATPTAQAPAAQAPATQAPTTQATLAPTQAATAPAGVPVPTTGGGALIKVGVVGGAGANPLFLAQGRGYYQQQGVTVQFITVASGAEMLPLMASDQLDAGLASPAAALFNAIGQGVSLKAVADAGRQDTGAWWAGMVVRPELLDNGTIKTPQDLRGRTIAVTGPGVGTYLNTVRLLESNGMTDKDVNLTYLNFADMLSALGSGKVDAADIVEPSITLGESRGILKRFISNAEISPGEQEAVVMITPKLAANTDLANRFLLAYVQAVHDYRDAFGPEKTNQDAVVEAMLPLLPDGYTSDLVRKLSPLALDPDGLVNGSSLKDEEEWYAAHGFVKTPVDTDKVVDNTFAEHARDALKMR
jgi:NitT/TauT family transport system substrate-binding protein